MKHRKVRVEEGGKRIGTEKRIHPASITVLRYALKKLVTEKEKRKGQMKSEFLGCPRIEYFSYNYQLIKLSRISQGVAATFRLRVSILFPIHFYGAVERRLKPAATNG